MDPRRARRLAILTFSGSVLLCLVTLVFLVLAWRISTLPTEFGPKGFAIAFSLSMGGVGAVVAARRPSNPIGWIFSGLGLASGVMAIGVEYARWALLVEGGRPAAGLYAAWVEEWLWIPIVAGLAVVAAIFPDGRFLSRRWRIAVIVAIVLAVIPIVLSALIPRFTIYQGFENPLGVGGPGMLELAEASIGLMIPLFILGSASAIVRFRRARGEERQQLKWLAASMSLVALLLVFYGVIAAAAGATPENLDWAEYLMIAGFVSVPISIAFGVLKYRLYDIDVVINKAVVYGAIAVFITAIYVAIVLGIGAVVGTSGDTLLSAGAAAVVALAFQPIRRGAQRLANRVVYGERATPYEVLADLGSRLAGEYAAEDVLDRVATTLAGGVGAEQVVVWLAVRGELRPAGVWPAGASVGRAPLIGDDAPTQLDGVHTVAVRHQGEMLGAIGVRKPASDPLTPGDEKLVGDLAGQAGLVLRNVRLIEDLRASRQRLVAAQDQERRRIERNIHDGAQQQLVSLAVKIRLTDAMVGKDDEKAHTLLADLQAETTDALENLRDLARGIYPPLLADQGLVAALQAQARKAPVPVELFPDGVGRYPQDVEAAVYFCVLEAMQNVAKYASASRVGIRLGSSGDGIRFAVKDDGTGFDPASAHGTGLMNMRDRVDALGGRLEIQSAPGTGTVVSGWIPAEASR